MTVKNVEKLEKSRVAVTVEVGAEEFEAAVAKAYAKARGKLSIPGFRPGKAPRKMIEKLYGAGVFYSDAVDIALPEAYTQAIGQSGLDVVGYPEIEIVDDKIDENGFTFKATVAVYPEVKLGEYKGLTAEKEEIKVSADDVKERLNEMAERNAREEVERVTTAAEREDKTLRSLAAMCGLSAAPKRMESYDISNTGASDIVASMVVYEGAKPKKSAYRRFKIKSLSAHPDDYASMEEVLTRRIQRYLDGDEKFSPLPDVMLIDGGITHAGVAERVCAQMHVHVPIFGMVKDDRHRTRALVTAQGREIDLHAAPNVFALIGQIQEETHRFAITFHHESHSKSSTRSALDGIPGVGKVRAQALLKTFKSVRAIREADIFALERVLPKDAAASVYLHFHGETDEKKDEM